jgi:hypothetical protein
MALQLECPGCKAQLQVDESLAGKQGKCIHCGHRIIVPGGTGTSPRPISQSLFEATPEAMVRELAARGQSAAMFLFKPTAEGSYDLADVSDAELKCIVTEDINAARFAQFVASIARRYAPRKKVQSVPAPGSSAMPAGSELFFELKGDQLGMSLDEFKRKYAREGGAGREKLPLCSDDAWGPSRAALHVEPWHQRAGIVHARIDLPSEDNSPTIASVKTDLLLYHFVDGKLFRISAYFPTDLFHLVSEAATAKYGPPTDESQNPRQLVWENAQASVVLTRGMVHPPQPSALILVHKAFAEIAQSRTPKGIGDI